MRKEEVEKLTEIIKKKKLKQMAEDYLEKAQENLEDEDAKLPKATPFLTTFEVKLHAKTARALGA